MSKNGERGIKMVVKAKPQKGKSKGIQLPQGIIYGSVTEQVVAKPKKRLRDWVWALGFTLFALLVASIENLVWWV